MYRQYHDLLDRFVIKGEVDAQGYEDGLRTLLGTSSYILFTMDKVISHTMKQLDNIIEDDDTVSLVNLLRASRVSPAIPEATLRAYAHQVLEDSNCYRVEVRFPERKMSITMLQTPPSEELERVEPFADWLAKVGPGATPDDLPEGSPRLFVPAGFVKGVSHLDLATERLNFLETDAEFEARRAKQASLQPGQPPQQPPQQQPQQQPEKGDAAAAGGPASTATASVKDNKEKDEGPQLAQARSGRWPNGSKASREAAAKEEEKGSSAGGEGSAMEI